jgi:dihydrofolate reductase
VSATVLYMSMSLDGFIAGPNEGPGNGLGDEGERLHEWFFAGSDEGGKPDPGRLPGVNGQVVDEFMTTGAVVAGHGTFEPAGGWGGDHHDGVPIFILTRTRTPADVEQWPLITVLDDVSEAIARAKQAAGDRDVLVHGVGVAAAALLAGVLDEVQLHLVPTILGEGRHLFEGIGAEPHEFELTRLVEGPGITHLRYRVL